MAYEKHLSSREPSVHSDPWKQPWDEDITEDELLDRERESTPGKRTRTQGKRASSSMGPGKSQRTRRIMDEMIVRRGLPVASPGRPHGSTDSSTAGAPVLRKAKAGDTTGRRPSAERLDALLAESTGAPLDSELARRMGAALGHDVAHVQVHTDEAAAQAASQLGARAFTVGSHVFFGRGELAPGTSQGEQLLAHELVHVQQADHGRLPHASGSAGESVQVSSPADAVEREAESRAAGVAAQARALGGETRGEAGGETGGGIGVAPGVHGSANTHAAAPARGAAPASTGSMTSMTPRAAATVIHRDTGGTGTTDPAAAEEAQPLTQAEVESLLQSELGITGSTLLSYIAPEHEGKTEDEIKALDKNTLIADGRSAWRSAVGDDGAYLRALASETGDSQAASKLDELAAESNWDPAANPASMLESFYSSVADAAQSSEYFEGSLYSAGSGPFADAAAGHTQKGRPIEVQSGSDLTARYGGALYDFYKNNLTAGYHTQVATDLKQYVADEYQSMVDSLEFTVYSYWQYLFSTGNLDYQSNVNEAGSYQGTGTSTWWPGVELQAAPSLAAAGYSSLVDLSGATPQPAAETGGYVEINIDPAALADSLAQIRKPTAMDGMTGADYTPPTETQWAVMGEGAPPLLAPTVPQTLAPIEWTYVTLENQAIVWSRLQGFAQEVGNNRGKTLFSSENNPRLIMLRMLGYETEVSVPPSEAGGSQNVQSPGIDHPGAQVTSAEVTLGAEGELQGGTAHVDVQGGGAIEADDANLAITPEGAESGTIATEVENASSSLGEIIDGISVNGRLIEGGVEGEITIAGGTIGGVTLENGVITVRYVNGQVTGEGTIGVNAADGKLTGQIGVSWDGAGWTLTGEGTVSDLIPGVEPFDVGITYAGESLTITANGVAFTQQVGAIEISGNLDNLSWVQESNSFSGSVQLDVDLGTFGAASGTALIEGNAISQAAITYTSPRLAYPEENPVVGGQLTATFTYQDGGLTADFDGTANIELGEMLGDASNLAMTVDATLSTDGTYSGTVQTTERLTIGQHFAINGITLNVATDGSLSGDFAIEVIDVPFLQNASVTGSFGPDGLSLGGNLTLSQSTVGGVDITGGSLALSYEGGAITGSGNLSLSAAGGKLSGTVDAGYDGAAWTISGTAQVSDLIPGLEPFDVDVNYAGENLTISAESVEFEQELNGVTIAGTATGLSWDQNAASFNGTVNLNIGLGLFGQATAVATIANNELSEATVTYDNPEIRYPVEGETPILSGAVNATLDYTKEGISGTFTGNANFVLGDLAGSGGSQLGLAVNASLANDGSYSGTIATTEPLNIGPNFVINGVTLNLGADGALTGDFAIEVVNVPFLESASITGSVDENGLNLGGAIEVSTGNIGGVEITGGSITLAYAGGAITGSGDVSVSALEGKISGTVNAAYDGTAWTLAGTAQVQELIPNLEAFDVNVSYSEAEGLVIGAESVSYSQEIGALTFSGTLSNIVWDTNAGSLSGGVALDVDLGLFGAATATATLANNQLENWVVTYTSPELTYPKGSESPLFTGTMSATLAYENDQLSGSFTGTANLAMPELGGQEISNLGLQVDATLAPDGTYSGTIATTETLQIGDYFAIPGISATLAPDGSLSGTFSVEVRNLPYLENASISCAIDENGLTVTAASAHAEFGDENSRASGSVDLSYAEGDGFIIGGAIAIKLADGMVATGTMTYTTASNEVSAELGMEAIPLIDMAGEQRTLLEFDRQFIIFSLYQILGLYLDVGFDLAFDYNLNLSATPTLTLTGLSLEDFGFDEASAEVGFLGALSARLMATPNLGVGIFVLHPALLRGGGGVAIPIVAEAVLTPTGTFGISYSPEGGVDGDATLGLALSFEVKGSVVPYAEFSVLDGAIEENWQGDSLADFEILPKRELFNYVIDFNNLGEEPAAPELPTTLQEPSTQSASQTMEQDAGTATQTPVQANREASGQQPGGQQEGAEAPGGLDIPGLIGGLASGGNLGALREVLDAAAGVWDSIQGNIQAVKDFFANWFTSASQTIVEVLNTIRDRGFVGLLTDVLRAQLGDDVYYIFEPLLEAAGDLEQQLITLLTTPIAEFNFDTMLDLVSGLLGLAWNSIGALVSSIGTVINRAAAAGERLVGRLVQEGKVGVRRHPYYIPLTWIKFLAADEYKIHVAGVDMQFRNGDVLLDPRNAVAAGLHAALEGLSSVPPTDTSINDYTGEPYNNYWV